MSAAVLVLAAPSTASADAVSDWSLQADLAIVIRGGQSLHAAIISYAIVNGAVYDAVNAIARTHQPYLVRPRAKRWYSQNAAAASAAYRVLVHLFPEQRAALQPAYDASLAAIPDGRAKDGGIATGEAAADAMIEARENDGRGAPFEFKIGTNPGEWRPTPPTLGLDPAPWVANLKPFAIRRAEDYRTDGPNALRSKAYARDLNETRALGSASSTVRTADQTDAARWWHVPPIGPTFRSLAADHDLSTAENARLHAMTYIAGADATIACYNDKYYWNYWRPITGIHEAASDGNPATQPDPSWTALIPTPSWPEHPSGHICGGAAMLTTFRTFFGTDAITFGGVSPYSGTTRTLTSFSQALREFGNARIWGGMHLRTAVDDAETLGKRVARYVRRHEFRPRGGKRAPQQATAPGRRLASRKAVRRTRG